MAESELSRKMQGARRYVGQAQTGDPTLGPFSLLPGTWANVRKDAYGNDTDEPLPGRGWNLIALPFAQGRFNYRVLMNQYNETLKFTTISNKVPNRGIDEAAGQQTDQLIVTLDYEQTIRQIAAEDFPPSDVAGDPDEDIHHEPGLFLHMANQTTSHVTGRQEKPLSIGRLGTIPHGNSLLALGHHEPIDGPPDIPEGVDALPLGTPGRLGTNPYLDPYNHFELNPFRGLFRPTDTARLLREANDPAALDGFTIDRTTVLNFDTELEDAGIVNIPFIVKQANAASMKSTFWIQELSKGEEQKFRLQYLQVVMLDFFFPRRDGMPGAVRWPHISINTMEKVAEPPTTEPEVYDE